MVESMIDMNMAATKTTLTAIFWLIGRRRTSVEASARLSLEDEKLHPAKVRVVSEPSEIEKGAFRTVLGHFASGVTVVAGVDAEGPVGLTCQSFFSLSLDPPLIAIAPARTSVSWPRVEASGSFCVNILADDQEAIAWAFASSGGDKFAGVGWQPATTGSPRLLGALAWIDCDVEEVLDGGDHQLVVGRVRDLGSEAGEPLLFYRGGLGTFQA
jgi:3-hydroxy-9,10-secoandrosta-1,3,5(10)-triene-9,17-dione monooxygenase reductase component